MAHEKPFDPFKAEFMLSDAGDFMPLASAAKGMYDAFLKIGFPDNKAYDLTRACIIQMLANMRGAAK